MGLDYPWAGMGTGTSEASSADPYGVWGNIWNAIKPPDYSAKPTPAVPAQGFDGSTATPGNGPLPTAPMPPVQGLDVPATIAKTAADRGIPPPAQDAAPAVPSWISGVLDSPSTVGQALTGQGGAKPPTDVSGARRGPGAPMDIRTDVEKGAAPAAQAAAQEQPKPGLDNLVNALKGIKAPANPELQKLSTPAAPKPTATVQGGQLLALLNAMAGRRK